MLSVLDSSEGSILRFQTAEWIRCRSNFPRSLLILYLSTPHPPSYILTKDLRQRYLISQPLLHFKKCFKTYSPHFLYIPEHLVCSIVCLTCVSDQGKVTGYQFEKAISFYLPALKTNITNMTDSEIIPCSALADFKFW